MDKSLKTGKRKSDLERKKCEKRDLRADKKFEKLDLKVSKPSTCHPLKEVTGGRAKIWPQNVTGSALAVRRMMARKDGIGTGQRT